MPVVLNVVPKIVAYLYPGDDQPFWFVPDLTNDESGIPIEDWTIVLGLRAGRIPLGNAIGAATILLNLDWNDTDSRFEGSIPHTTTFGMVPGQWTGAIWRTNNLARRQLAELEITVRANVTVPTTSSTTTTTTTTP